MTDPMTEGELILVLEAACCAARPRFNNKPDVKAAVGLLAEILEKEIGEKYDQVPFGNFLTAQKKAVDKLSVNPSVFGFDLGVEDEEEEEEEAVA